MTTTRAQTFLSCDPSSKLNSIVFDFCLSLNPVTSAKPKHVRLNKATPGRQRDRYWISHLQALEEKQIAYGISEFSRLRFNIFPTERMMRLTQASLYSFITTCYGGCFYFAFGVFTTLAQKGNIAEFLGNFVVSMLVCFAAFTFIFYELMGAFEELNRPRNAAEQNGQKDEKKDAES